MDFDEFSRVYENYDAEYLAPALPILSAMFEEWKSNDFWLAEKSFEDPVIPTPIYNVYARRKRAGSTWEKLNRLYGNGCHVDYDKLDSLDDLLGIRVVMYLSSSYPLVHAALARSGFVEKHPHFRPRCYLPISMVKRLGLPGAEFEISDVKDSGYGSIHYTVRFTAATGLTIKRVELQVRTILLEAWGEIEHQLNYKSAVESDVTVKRQLRVIADSLRAVDEHFEIVHEHARYLRGMQGAKGTAESEGVLDDGILARLLAQHEVVVSESELGRLRRIISSRRILTVSDLRSRTTTRVINWIREDLNLLFPGQRLDASTLISIVALLPGTPSRDDVHNAVVASREEVRLTEKSDRRLFPRYRE